MPTTIPRFKEYIHYLCGPQYEQKQLSDSSVLLESGVNFSGFCKKQPENEIPATFFAAVDEILKYSHPIISRFEPVAQV
jgi:hypothetical protein